MSYPPTSDLTNQVMQSSPHRRFNPLTREWVLVSPHRAERPWQGQTEPQEQNSIPPYDPNCYLCPGNVRAEAHETRPIPKRLSSITISRRCSPIQLRRNVDVEGRGILVAQTERGICRVVCFSPRHDLTLARMSPTEIRALIDVWVQEYEDLGRRPGINYVQIFENRGLMMGCSNPHPHWPDLGDLDDAERASQRARSFCARIKNSEAPVFCAITSAWRKLPETALFAAMTIFWR